MICVVTGDIINSRNSGPVKLWMEPLRSCLQHLGSRPRDWEIYRGDSFQYIEEEVSQALRRAIYIKATLKSIKDVDVRMGIGIGSIDYRAARALESNGEAFIHSGEAFSNLEKSKKRMAFKTPWEDFDQLINTMLDLASTIMDHWSPKAAEVVAAQIDHHDFSQEELGEYLGKTQAAISKSLSRAYFEQLRRFEEMYRVLLTDKLEQ